MNFRGLRGELLADVPARAVAWSSGKRLRLASRIDGDAPTLHGVRAVPLTRRLTPTV